MSESTALEKVGGKIAMPTAAFVRDTTTTAYTAGDVVSQDSVTATALMKFPNCAGDLGGSGTIIGAQIATDKKSITPQMRLELYTKSEATVSVPLDNAAKTSIYANAPYKIGYIDFPALSTDAGTSASTASVAQLVDIARGYTCDAGDTALYGVLVDETGHTPNASQNWKVVLTVLQN